MKWFKHDANAHRDAKLKKLIMSYGLEGYGLYWHCLEEIASSVSQDKYTFELEHDAEIIAFDTGISATKVQEMMTFMVNVGLFENNHGVITCLKMAKRLDSSMTSNQEMRNIISRVKKSHDSIMTQSVADKKRLEEIRREDNKSMSSRPVNDCPYQKIVDLYHEVLPNHPKVRVLTQARKSAIKQRHMHDMDCSLEEWESYFGLVKRSKFLTGQTQPMNGGRVFIADLEWITKQGNFAKIYEGKYHG